MVTKTSNVRYIKSREKFVYLTQKATKILRKKGKVPIAKLTWDLGYTSPEYFRRSVLPIITMLSDCIRVNDSEVMWVCIDEEENSEEMMPRDELSVLSAKPVDEEPKSSEVK